MSAVRAAGGRIVRRVGAHPVFWTAAVLLVLGQAALRWWALQQAFFFQDDFVYTHLARTMPVAEFVALDYRGHLQPGQFMIMAVLARLAPLDWTVHAGVLLVIQLAFDAVLLALLVRMFGVRLAVLVPFAVVLFSPLSVPPLLWFAAALQWLPLALATVVLLLCHLRLGDATGRIRRRWRLVAAVTFLLALLCWERALSVVGVLALAEVTWFARDRGRARFTAPLRKHRALWAWYVVLTVGYLAVYAAVSVGTPTALPSGTDLLALLRETAGTLVPGLLGGPWGVEDGAETLMRPPDQPLPWVVAQLAVLVVALLSTAGPRRLTRAWTVPLALLALDVAVVALTRLDFIGALIARDPRYLVDAVPLAAVALGVTFLPVLPVEGDDIRASRVTRWRGWPRAARLVALVVVLGFVVNSGWITTATIARSHADNPGRGWVQTVRQQVADLPPGIGVRDTPAPPSVVSPIFGQEAMTSRVLGSLPEFEGRIGTTTNDLRDVAPDGSLTTVLVDPPLSSPVGPVGDCGYRLAGRPVTIPLERSSGQGWLLRIEYLAATTAPARVEAGEASFEVQFADGVGVISLFPPGPVSKVRITGVDADLPVCVTRVAAAPPLTP